MTQSEKNALLRYMDFQLTRYVDKFSPHIPAEILQEMYDEAYRTLNDLHLTLDMDMALKAPRQINKKS